MNILNISDSELNRIGNISYLDIMEKMEKEYPNEYKKANDDYVHTDEGQKRFYDYIGSFYPKIHKDIQLRDKLHKQFQDLGKQYGIDVSYYHSGQLVRLKDSILEIIDLIEKSKNKSILKQEFDKYDLNLIKRLIDSTNSRLFNSYYSEERKHFNKEYLDYLNRLLDYAKERIDDKQDEHFTNFKSIYKSYNKKSDKKVTKILPNEVNLKDWLKYQKWELEREYNKSKETDVWNKANDIKENKVITCKELVERIYLK